MSAASAKESDTRPLSEKEILELPDWGVVALAARCAMRVQPLVGTESFGEITREEIAGHIEAIEMAVTIAAVPSAAAVRAAARAAARAAHAAAAHAAAAHAENAAARAAASHAARAATRAAVAAAAHVPRAAAHAHAATRADYKDLLSSGRDEWNADFMNQPLWPSGEPKGWRKHLDAWGEKVRALAEEFPYLRHIYKRHIRLIDGKGTDVAKDKERIKAWAKAATGERGRTQARRGESKIWTHGDLVRDRGSQNKREEKGKTGRGGQGSGQARHR